MTKRRLINKKAYDEMLLLKKLAISDESNTFEVLLQVDENGNEGFIVDHYVLSEWKARIAGENYTIISKLLIEYLNRYKK